jgi:hypothetical protein
MTDWHGTYYIFPDKTGNLMYDDWHEGFENCVDKKFPQHIENKAYMNGWLEGLGMEAGYANIPLFFRAVPALLGNLPSLAGRLRAMA